MENSELLLAKRIKPDEAAYIQQVSNPQAGDDWLTADITYELKGP